MKELSGKVAAITGAGSGIGRALAQSLASRGCHLALSDVNEESLYQTVASLTGHGVRVTRARLDVAKREAVYAWADQVVVDHGKVNMIFNNAGVSVAATVEGIEYEDFDWIMDINFWGVVYGTKAFLPHLIASGEGHVINVSSVFGIIAQPGQSAYNASKFAVRGFTEALSQELELQRLPVRATSVHPGGIKTNIARTARHHASMERLIGSTHEETRERFEKVFLTTTPEEAARVILDGVARNKRRVLIGRDARIIDRLQRLFPSAYQAIMAAQARRLLKRRKI